MNNMKLPPIESLSKDVQEKLKSLPEVNLYKRLAILEKSFIPILDVFNSFYTKDSNMPPKLREIAILRVGRNTGSSYEVHQHKLVSKSTGLASQDVNYILIENEVTQLSKTENLVCKAVDEFTSYFSLTEETQEEFYSLLPTKTVMELILLISMYTGLACFIKGTDVQIETDNPLKGKNTPL
ncbi:MAG TPA: hypothetical protein QF753_01065 [Victivallales bacterium]|nr:hypothetical protein [Victivallales bacterium]